MRNETVKRKTNETDVALTLNLDGSGVGKIDTGCGFLDHMLTLFARHGGFDLSVKCVGDTFVDDHHTTEDIGICLGKAFCAALGDKAGIRRYGSMMLPMDETLVLCAVDLSGRSYFVYDVEYQSRKIGTFDTELVEVFFSAFAANAGMTLHLKKMAGGNSHHVAEACFKAAARVLSEASSLIPGCSDIPSSKGVL